MKTAYITCLFLMLSAIGHAQYVIENYSNAEIDQLPAVEEIANWIQFNSSNNVIPLLENPNTIDRVYLNTESAFLSLKYDRNKVDSKTHHYIDDDRNIVWYERDFYKKSKSKLKPRYQIYFTVEFVNNSYKIIDLKIGKKKKINTGDYSKN
ncbi:hypothetical protein BZARG_946 [Bizionia argentinensis JUB59]|uniref:Uncharacterized protein n=1 Tax=Bizionia argentinensis JUB59 TaxID=1046627 RepID=G2EBR7_9FLAO|nr:hypothetical protein [Bizionia argentinensis]EGV44164.1 hypothetical protein BZARG_946 [Bizionia argentinensis JUB59]